MTRLKQEEIRIWKRLYFELIYSKETPEEVKLFWKRSETNSDSSRKIKSVVYFASDSY